MIQIFFRVFKNPCIETIISYIADIMAVNNRLSTKFNIVTPNVHLQG